MMTIIRLKGKVTDDGRLEVDLPHNIPVGEVFITLETSDTTPQVQVFGELVFEPATGAEIIAMLDATDGWWDTPSPD